MAPQDCRVTHLPPSPFLSLPWRHSPTSHLFLSTVVFPHFCTYLSLIFQVSVSAWPLRAVWLKFKAWGPVQHLSPPSRVQNAGQLLSHICHIVTLILICLPEYISLVLCVLTVGAWHLMDAHELSAECVSGWTNNGMRG